MPINSAQWGLSRCTYLPPACVMPHRACPGGGYAGSYYWNVYQFDNPGGAETCVTVAYTAGTCNGGFDGMLQAYQGDFPDNGVLCPPAGGGYEYVGDIGSSTFGQMQFIIPAGQTRWSLVATNVFSVNPCTMEVTISGFSCQ